MLDSYDPNELLGISPGSSEEEIRKAFRRKAKLVHPDVSDAPDAAEQFTRLKAAYDLLLERLTNPSAPTPDDLYRPARDVTPEEQERIIKSFRRRRQAEERRRSRRSRGPSGRTRQAQREQREFQEEMARRRAAHARAEREREEREELERARSNRERLERERGLERERKANLEQEKEEKERARQEEQRRHRAEQREQAERRKQEQQERARLEQEGRQREAQERLQRASVARTGQDSDTCAWKDCAESNRLSAPVETLVGLRRFCMSHYEPWLALEKQRRQPFVSNRQR